MLEALSHPLVIFFLGMGAAVIGYLIALVVGSVLKRLDNLEKGGKPATATADDTQRRLTMVEAAIMHVSKDAEDHKAHAAAIAVLQSGFIDLRNDVTWIRRRLENFQVVTRQSHPSMFSPQS